MRAGTTGYPLAESPAEDFDVTISFDYWPARTWYERLREMARHVQFGWRLRWALRRGGVSA